MAHKFERSEKDPYVEAVREVEDQVFKSRKGFSAGAGEELYGTLGDAIVTALGDVAHQAFRYGVNQPDQVKGLAKAIANVSEDVLTSYLGEVDPEPAILTIEENERIARLTPENQDKLKREIEKTRQYESLVLHAMRLPLLQNFAGSMGLPVDEEAVDQGTVLVPGDLTPSTETG